MRVYGYDSTDIYRGEISGAEVDKSDLDYPECLKARLGWDYLSTSFAEAKKNLILEMKREHIDEDMIATVRGIKASYVSVLEV